MWSTESKHSKHTGSLKAPNRTLVLRQRNHLQFEIYKFEVYKLHVALLSKCSVML